METRCRLCAKNKSTKQLAYNIDDPTLNIEQKLMDCCRWNFFIANDELSKNICRTCFKRLENSWSFAESVAQAQDQLLALIIDIKQELPIIDYLDAVGGNDETNEPGEDGKVFLSSSNSILDFDIDPISHVTKESITELSTEREQLTTRKTRHHTKLSTVDYSNYDQFEFTEEKSVFQIDPNDSILKGTEDNKLDIFDTSIANNQRETTMNIENSDVKILTMQSDSIKHNLPDMIQDDERNDDGTVKIEAVQRLSLENWTLIQYRCYLCKTRFPDRYEFRNHFKAEHPEHQLRHLCTICNKKHYKQWKAMTQHVINRHRRYFKNCCLKCNAYFWDLRRLKEHSRCCGRDKTFLCDFCGKELKNESLLRDHRKIHLPNFRRTFECFMCKKSFAAKKNLKYHMPLHMTEQRPTFKCSICSSQLLRNSFKRHMRTHLDIFPFQCPHCPKKFKFKEKLNTHIRTHTGERPFRCSICEYRCVDSGNIHKHLKQKHGIQSRKVNRNQTNQDG